MSEDQLKLLEALKENNVEEFVSLLENHDVDPSYSYGKPDWGTCLELACKIRDRGRFVEVLLKKVKPNRNVLQPEAIHVAAKYGNFGALQVLLRDKRTRINAEDKKGRTALHLLACNFRNDPLRYERCFELLLARSDVDVNRPNIQGCTAIYEAAVYGGKDAVIAMLNFCPAGMDVDTQRGDGRTAREEILKSFPNLGPLLPPLKVAAPSTSEPQTVLLAALQNKYLGVFKGLLQQVDSDGARVMNPDHFYSKPFNCTCLESACRETRLHEFVDVLLQAGADPNYVNPITEAAPIHVAARCVNMKALKLLLVDKRTNVNIADSNSNTALHCAAAFVGSEDDAVERNKNCVNLLLSHETIDLNIRNNKNLTPIMEAAENGNRYVVDLISEMSDKLLLDLDGIGKNGGLTAREYLTKIFPDIELPSLHIMTSEDPFKIHKVTLFNELYKHQTEKFQMTVRLIINNNMQELIDSDDGTNTLLQYACTYGYSEETKILLTHGANPNHKCNINRKPSIVIACLHGHFDVLNILLTHSKIKINETDRKGNTALHIASKQKNLEAVVRLINCGADLKAKNVFGVYPLTPHAMKSLFDQCLKPDETFFPEDDNYKFTFQYDLLIAHRSKITKCHPENVFLRSQNSEDYFSVEFETSCNEQDEDSSHEMEFLRFIAESGLYNELLKHPIVTSFLCVKWPKLKKFYAIDIIWCISFVIVFNSFVALKCNAMNEATCSLYSWLILVSLIGILLLMMAVRKVARACVEFKGYFRDYENWFDIILFSLTIASCIFTSSTTAVLCVIMSWTKLIFLTGQLATFSGNIHMLKTVCMNFARVFALYSSLLMMFVVCFYVLFRRDEQQNGVPQSSDSNFTFWYSTFRVIVMMTGEYDANSLPLNNVPYVSHFVFCLFIFLVSIVLLNLLTGLAVNDIQAVKKEAEILGIHSRILLMSDIEKHWLPILGKFVNTSDTKVFRRSETVIDVFPNKQKLPAGTAWNLFSDNKLNVEDHIDIDSLQGALKIIAEKSMTDNRRVTKNDVDDMKNELFQLIHDLSRKLDNRTESVSYKVQ